MSGAHLLLGSALLGVLLPGCGFLKAGTWEDDPKNWQRAFDAPLPPDVVVVHSKYWRSPHWTHECAYSFEVEATGAVREHLFDWANLARASPKDVAEWKADLGPESPAWFCPKPLASYEAWTFAQEPKGHFKLLVDPETGHLFLNDYQL
ncbi:MAG TPA: hypothetical protein VGR31_10945 [Planctomycetota bacterium]|nr:hypothetical protein [Planctomycetota bacterium]